MVIRKLPTTVINQIAAGEVVENPASIVKELIENSLDAHATVISVEIVAGGQQLIRIEDNGTGMAPEDALLSLERHATSKIGSVDDLQTLATMGFRGEALAAISSVSQFELKTSKDGIGTHILAEGGEIKSTHRCARNQGTSIEVRSLFYNVPARKKFQKSASTNGSQVARVVESMALAHPKVSFTLTSQGRKVLETSADPNWKKRIEEIIGEHEHEVQFHNERFSITGVVAAPAKATPRRLGQHLFINRRPIFSPVIAHAVKEAFATRIAENSYPQFVLFLEVPPDFVDVNVHPQKKEVRFQNEGEIFRFVQEAVGKVFVRESHFNEPLSFELPPAFSFTEPSSEPSQFITTESVPHLEWNFHEKTLGLFGKYLLLQKEGLILVDLSRAEARILFESLTSKKGEKQPLLWPLEVELLPGEEELVHELTEMGIECRYLGKKMVAVDTLPSTLEASSFPQFLNHWREEKKLDRAVNKICGKKNYSIDLANFLWQEVKKCQDCLYDPLGRVIWKEIREEDFAKLLLTH